MHRISIALFLIAGLLTISRAEQPNIEADFIASVSSEEARRHLRFYTAEPHIAGSSRDYQTAIYTRDRLREAGIAAELVEYEVWLPYLKQARVEMLRPKKFKASLKEDPVAEDPDSIRGSINVFSAYSASGDVTAEVVYVNYGLQEDYRKLASLGVSVKGRIALARYGGAFRGVKAKLAEEQGAIGLIIYSDPANDGYMLGDIYPKGPYRPPSGIQRGSVGYTFQYPGDPLTPGRPSIRGEKRLKPEEAKSLPHIPVQPISYQDASPILEALGGPNVPAGWQGGLPFAYHTGPGNVRVRLQVKLDYKQRKIWNVIGEVKGSVEPDRLVILGNHRDAWVHGAVDPSSGSAALLTVARALGAQLQKGWRPARTILFCSWDAEEFGLIGSTEWVEQHRERLERGAVVYINVDSAVSGTNYYVSGVPSLAAFVRSVMQDLKAPRSERSIYEHWAERRKIDPQSQEMQLGSLGGGSDFTPFLQHAGIPSLDMGFSGSYGVYHSVYDSFHWMEKFGDPDFITHAAAARIWGVLALRMATAKVLPFRYEDYASQIKSYVQKLDHQGVDLKRLLEAAEAFQKASISFRAYIEAHPDRADRINEAMIAVERALIDPAGLPGREWYRHVIYAPGYYAGYDAEAFAGLKQALDEQNSLRAEAAAEQARKALERAAQVLSNVQLLD